MPCLRALGLSRTLESVRKLGIEERRSPERLPWRRPRQQRCAGQETRRRAGREASAAFSRIG